MQILHVFFGNDCKDKQGSYSAIRLNNESSKQLNKKILSLQSQQATIHYGT